MTAMKRRSVALGGLIAFALTACSVAGLGGLRGSGNISSETREVGSFSQVVVSGNTRVFVTQGATPSLVVEVDDNLMEYVRAEVDDFTLHLGFASTGDSYAPTQPLTFRLTVRRLPGLELNGAGSIEATNINAPRLVVEISGSGRVRLTGKVEEQYVTLNGSGTYDAAETETKTTRVRVNGAGTATVWASDALNARLSGSGRINYYGQPQVSRDISGSGQVKHLGAR